jgi:hypothetical protein
LNRQETKLASRLGCDILMAKNLRTQFCVRKESMFAVAAVVNPSRGEVNGGEPVLTMSGTITSHPHGRSLRRRNDASKKIKNGFENMAGPRLREAGAYAFTIVSRSGARHVFYSGRELKRRDAEPEIAPPLG